MIDAAFLCPCATHTGKDISLALTGAAFVGIAVSTVVEGVRKRRSLDRRDGGQSQSNQSQSPSHRQDM